MSKKPQKKGAYFVGLLNSVAFASIMYTINSEFGDRFMLRIAIPAIVLYSLNVGFQLAWFDKNG